MSTEQTFVIQSDSSEATEKIGEQLGRNLRGGEVIELASDLGGGKTTFIRGVAKGLGSPDAVSSPTFMISQVYKSANIDLYHFDLYRLGAAGLMSYELIDVIGKPGIVTVVEWADVARTILPDDRMTIAFSKSSEDARELTLHYAPTMEYLLTGLKTVEA